MRKITVSKGKIAFSDEVIGFIEKIVTPFGNSAKVDCPKEFIGKKAYLIICKR
jgi:putative transposon-encoded protein